MQRIVLYHGNCADGFAAAWAVWRKFGSAGTEYRAVHYGRSPPDVEGKEVVIVDFSYPRSVLVQMHATASSLLVLDHHVSAQKDLDGLDYCEFDMARSGAGMAWDYFHGADTRNWIVNAVEDRDLWRWERETTAAEVYGLDLYARDFEVYNELLGQRNKIMREGDVVLRHITQQADKLTNRARFVTIGGYEDVPVVNSSWCPSEVGHMLLSKYPNAPFVGVWSEGSDGSRRYSLRSEDHRVDVSEVAAKLGGGGHRNAAGFRSE